MPAELIVLCSKFKDYKANTVDQDDLGMLCGLTLKIPFTLCRGFLTPKLCHVPQKLQVFFICCYKLGVQNKGKELMYPQFVNAVGTADHFASTFMCQSNKICLIKSNQITAHYEPSRLILQCLQIQLFLCIAF